MSDVEDQESILDNLNKTRQLWSSKADLGTPNYLIPKSPVSHSAPSTHKPSVDSLTNGNEHNMEVIKSDELVVEDYELPDIKSMRSQWEKPQSASFVPTPSAKSPAALAREKSIKHEREETSQPVNREEPTQEESYDIELTKLKAQFESAARAASKTRPKSPKSPMTKSAIKEQVSRSSTAMHKTARNVNKKIRFEDELTSSGGKVVTEQRTETDSLTVDLTNIKSQFESRKDEHLVTPELLSRQKPLNHSVTTHTIVSDTDARAIEVVRPDDHVENEHYEVELGELKKRFEQDNSNKKQYKRATPKQRSSPPRKEASSHDNIATHEPPRIETVKSSEPVYDEMVGEESVKDRLQRYKSLTESSRPKKPIERRFSQKRTSAPVVQKESEVASKVESSSNNEAAELEIVRSPPAGTKVTPDYVPSVDLRQTKALFETPDPKPLARLSSYKRASSASHSSVDSIPHSPSRSGRNSVPGSYGSRSSSRHSIRSASPTSRHSIRSASPSGRRSKSPATSEVYPIDDSDNEMSNVVKPPPAGTKETADYVPAVKVSSMKNMFEKPKSATSPTSAEPPRRRQLRSEDWANGNDDDSVTKNKSTDRIVSEGSFEDKGGIVRPPTAGTKERPAYHLSSDFLKSRAAMFESPPSKQYTPRNKIVSDENAPTEIVNAESQQSDVDYQLSTSMKDTKKMFENGGAVSPDIQPTKKQVEVVTTESGDVVRPPPAGTRDDSDIVPAADLSSAKSVFENQQAEAETSPKEQIDIRQEAMEAQKREQEISEKEIEAAVDVQAPEEPVQEPEEPVQEPEEPVQEPEESVQEPEEPVQEPEESVQEPEEPVQEPEEPVQEPKEPVQELAEPVQEPEEPVQEPEEPAQEPEDPAQEPEEPVAKDVDATGDQETPKADSDSETEGEYLIESSKQHANQEDEAAGVVPVRVAVPDHDDDPAPVDNTDQETRNNEEERDESHEENTNPDNNMVQNDYVSDGDAGIEGIQKHQTSEKPTENGVGDVQDADGSSNYLE